MATGDNVHFHDAVLALMKREVRLIAGLLFVLTFRLLFLSMVCQSSAVPWVRQIHDMLIPEFLSQVCTGKLQADAFIYDHLGRSFATEGRLDLEDLGLKTVVSPGFPVFMGVVYGVCGFSPKAVMLAYAFLDTLTALLLVLCLRSSGIRYRPVTEMLFLAVFALYLPYIAVILAPLSEGLFTLLMSVALLLIMKMDKGGKMTVISAGVVLGLAVLTRPLVLLLPVWLVIYRISFVPGERSRTRILLRYGLFFGVMLLTVAPWTIRNYLKYDKLIPVTSDRKPLVIGSGLLGPGVDTLSSTARNRAAYRTSTGLSMMGIAGRVLGRVLRHPYLTVKMWYVKMSRLCLNLGFDEKPSAGSIAVGAAQAILIAAAIFGIMRRPVVGTALWAPVVFFGYTVFFHVVFFTAKIRFIMPAMPFVLLMAVLAVMMSNGDNSNPSGRPVT